MDAARGGRFTTPCTFTRKNGTLEKVFFKDPYTLTFPLLGLTVDQVSFLPGLSFVIVSLTMQ